MSQYEILVKVVLKLCTYCDSLSIYILKVSMCLFLCEMYAVAVQNYIFLSIVNHRVSNLLLKFFVEYPRDE